MKIFVRAVIRGCGTHLGCGTMTTPRALFTPATWSEDDSDEEEHFREMVRLRIRHEERFKDVDDVNADDADSDAGHPLDPIWGEPPRTAGPAPRSPDSDVDENTDPWGDFGASPRRRKGGHDVDSTRRMDDSWSPNATFMPRTAEVRGLTSELAKLGIDVPYHASPGAEGGADTAVHDAALGLTRAQGTRMKPPVDHRRSSAKPRLKNNTMKPNFAVPASPAKPPLYAPPPSSSRLDGRTRRPTTNRLTAIKPSKLTVEAYELISPGALKESIHRGVYAHLWWSGGRASDDSPHEGADSEGADCFPYPIGFTVRATLRGQGTGPDDEDGRPKRLVGGVVRRSHHGAKKIGNDHPFGELGSGVCVVECSVEMSGASARKLANEPTHNSAWDGPCFRVTWMGGDASVLGSKVRKPRSKRWNGGTLTKPTGQGRTPSRALASLLETLGVKVPLHLPLNGDEVFGFTSGNEDATRVRARLDELARLGGDVAPVRLREPSGVGLALVRRGAYAGTGVARDGPVVRSQNDDAKVVGSNPSLVAAAVATPDVYIGADGKVRGVYFYFRMGNVNDVVFCW